MLLHRVQVRRWVVAGIGLMLVVHVAGCGGSRYPVEGRVLLEGKTLVDKEGAVVLKPDASKGNSSSESSIGVLQRDGSFSISEPGARPGWYKVVIIATDPGANPNEDAPRILHARYEKEATTPLAIEVVADPAPGKYDLLLSP